MTPTSLSTLNIITSIIFLYIRQTISCPQDYIYCTSEGGTCGATGNVAYGIQNSWVYKSSTGSIKCNNDVFTDPAKSLQKICCVQTQNPNVITPNVITPKVVIQNAQLSNTIIDGIWKDDFNSDPNQINGWNTYNNIGGFLNNPIITGASNRKYHGTFSRVDSGRQNYMKRQFQCLSKSNVYISYKFAYCETESADQMKMVWIGSQTTEKISGMDTSSGTHIRLDVLEGNGNTFESNLGAIKSNCNNVNEWNYQAVMGYYVGLTNADETWELIFSQIFSGSSEYGLLFDISINCDALLTPNTNPNTPPEIIPPHTPITPPEIIGVPVPQLPVPGPTAPAPAPGPQPVPGPGSNNNSINNSNNNSNNEGNNINEGNAGPPPSGVEIGAYGQWCALPAFNMKHQCDISADVISQTGNIECINPYECCMCEFIECNQCDLIRIGDYSAFGVSDITVYGNPIAGAIIECLGTASCKQTAMIGTDINMMLCKGQQSCQNALVTIDVVDFALECTEFESCNGLQMEITVSGSPPPSGFACPLDSPEILFSRLLCGTDRSCENLHVTINNKGCSTVMIEDILCSTPNACNNCIISDNNGNNIPCNSVEYIQIDNQYNNNNNNNNNNPSQIVNINPVTSAPQQPDINAKFCCHSSMPAFELWNGYCLMVTNGIQCNSVPNSRCIWNENDCFPNPQCAMREAACTNSDQCCSKVCLFQNPLNPLDGVCR